MGLLDGRVAIVTGAGRGIGRAEALALAAEGARVVVNDLGGSLVGAGDDDGPAQQVADEIRALGGEAVANVGSVADWEDAKALVAQALATWGRLDVVVNNAGVIRTAMSFNTSESDWDVVIDVHLKGTYAVSRFAGEHWREMYKRDGRPVDAAIVNTSSPNGLNGGSPGHVNYAVAKAGIATMTIVMARELSPYGVRVNAVAPVAFTRMTESLWGSGAFEEANREALAPEGIAAAATWLASPDAAGVNGQVLAITGGLCQVWEGWTLGASARTEGRWTVDALSAARPALFAGRSSDIPDFPGGR